MSSQQNFKENVYRSRHTSAGYLASYKRHTSMLFNELRRKVERAADLFHLDTTVSCVPHKNDDNPVDVQLCEGELVMTIMGFQQDVLQTAQRLESANQQWLDYVGGECEGNKSDGREEKSGNEESRESSEAVGEAAVVSPLTLSDRDSCCESNEKLGKSDDEDEENGSDASNMSPPPEHNDSSDHNSNFSWSENEGKEAESEGTPHPTEGDAKSLENGNIGEEEKEKSVENNNNKDEEMEDGEKDPVNNEDEQHDSDEAPEQLQLKGELSIYLLKAKGIYS